MNLLLLGYAIAAFIAGLVALAMPCCFSVLLPSYFAQSFKLRSHRVGMAVVVSMGIATIMLPLAFGLTYLGRILGTNHMLTFVAGGSLMVAIGFWTLWGRGMLPRINFPVNLNRADAASVLALGMFSGDAPSCCAPVLAGILILTALSASILEGLLIGFIYVLGMVSPLFVIALAWDKHKARVQKPLQGRALTLKVFGRELSIHSTRVLAGVVFLVTGAVNILVGLTGTMIPAPGSSFVGNMQAQLQTDLLTSFSTLSLKPAPLIGIIAAACIVLLVLVGRLRRSGRA